MANERPGLAGLAGVTGRATVPVTGGVNVQVPTRTVTPVVSRPSLPGDQPTGGGSSSSSEGEDYNPNDPVPGENDGSGGGGYYSRGGGGGGGGSSTSTSVSRQINITNPDTARNLLNGTLSQLLGREANSREFDAFLQALNKTERRNPTITRSTSTSSGTSSVSESRTRGGTDPAELAKRFAESQEDYSEYQGATTFLNAFIEGIRNPGRLI